MKKKKYQIIQIDPPWPIKTMSRIVRPQQLKMPYKIMTIREIRNLPMGKLINPDGCHLFLWTTQKFLPVALNICEDWGFEYHCIIVWDKEKGFTPFSFQWSTEFCIYAQLPGKWLRPKRIGMKTLIREKARGHSAKPRYIHSFIEEYAGDLPRADIFSRTVVKGWDRFGDETISNIDFI